MVEHRPIMSVKYCLPFPVFHFRPKLWRSLQRGLSAIAEHFVTVVFYICHWLKHLSSANSFCRRRLVGLLVKRNLIYFYCPVIFCFVLLTERRICDCSAVCGGEIQRDHGILSSPNYPEYYKPSKECVWKITVPDGFTAALKFQSFEVCFVLAIFTDD